MNIEIRRKAAQRRLLQYIMDAVVSGPDDVGVDRWLLSLAGYDEREKAQAQLLCGIAITTELERPTDLVRTLHVLDVQHAGGELERQGARMQERRSRFVYCEQWPDWSQATAAADRALKTPRKTNAGRGEPPEACHARSGAQQRLLEYVDEALQRGRHWAGVDMMLMEQAAHDAQTGYGQTGEEPASTWHEREAEFEMHGVWVRVEHRRGDQTARARPGAPIVGLLGDFRILDPERARELRKNDRGPATAGRRQTE